MDSLIVSGAIVDVLTPIMMEEREYQGGFVI